jgi:hypothetical protein
MLSTVIKQNMIVFLARSSPRLLRDAVYTRPHNDQLRSAAHAVGGNDSRRHAMMYT